MVKHIPWGDMRSLPDTAPEPWEVAAAHEEQRHGWQEQLLGPAPPRVLIGFTPTWGPEVAHYDPARVICPGCRDQPLRHGEGCVICSATSANSTRWPMQYNPAPKRKPKH